ncbi:hypothetical protein C8K66_10239 [Pseudomonas sp. GV105]|uniref:hypothetical protein n=1 Tax=Pseudomonas sp. GV105 TaxID=2135759 RepID=UPI000D33F61A|nr:hypothetical protein [Pseudomonas sp. GV105]PUB36560.1 hypothetical protein C8K66_10239 [Pseudomonas sp. GV105]
MSEVKRYRFISSNGYAAIPVVDSVKAERFVEEQEFDRVTAERDAALGREAALNLQISNQAETIKQLSGRYGPIAEALQQRLTVADERVDMLGKEVERLSRVKLSLKDLAESRADNCSVYREHLNEALTMAKKVRDASPGMQRKCLSDLIVYLSQNSGAALNPVDGGGDDA